MKTGRLAESVLKRSVLKWIQPNSKNIMTGAGIGENCAIFSFEQGENKAGAIAVYGNAIHSGIHGKKEVFWVLQTVFNRLACSGAIPAGVSASLLLPKETEEESLKELVKQIAQSCDELGTTLAPVQIQVTDSVLHPVLQVTAFGRADSEIPSVKRLLPGMDLVISKWIGLEGTFKIADARREELSSRFPVGLIENAAALEQFYSVLPEAATAIRSGACTMYYPDEGGIFGALWELAEGAGVGLDLELKQLPIRQETIELCEFYEISPYELATGGCLLMAAPNGYDLVRALEREAIPAAVVGKATKEKKRIIRNEEEIRFLEPPRSDEIHKVL